GAGLGEECRAVANRVVPGKNTPIPPTSVDPLKTGMPPGSVAIPRDWADGNNPEIKPYDSGAAILLPGGMNAGSALNRLFRTMSSAVPRMWSGPGLMMLSRLVCSVGNRSTCGVNGTRGGKCPFVPIGATN